MSLSFPFEQAPDQGEYLTVEICPDIKWVRMPLPMSLDHINCYLLKDGEGWCIVDTGMRSDEVEPEEHWENIISSCLDGKPITRVIVTHQHPDHIGLAGWLCRTYQVPLWTSQTEYIFAKAFSLGWEKKTDTPYWHTMEYFIRAGMSIEVLMKMREMRDKNESENKNKTDEFPFPSSYKRIREGKNLKIGNYSWEVIVTAGHAPEHVSLYCKDLDIYISGDQVLPGITSNVSVMPTEPEANPLEDWLEGLQGIKDVLPNTPLVLPSHELPFKGLHERIDQLLAHHDERMEIIINSCREGPKTAFELTDILFDRELEGHQVFIATGECIAHLHCLLERGEIGRELSEGKFLYCVKS